jgi:hypothetical protein
LISLKSREKKDPNSQQRHENVTFFQKELFVFSELLGEYANRKIDNAVSWITLSVWRILSVVYLLFLIKP